jgi:hypothetical protein
MSSSKLKLILKFHYWVFDYRITGIPLEINSLSDMGFLNILNTISCLFTLLIISFAVKMKEENKDFDAQLIYPRTQN